MQDLTWDEMEQRLEAAQARLAPLGVTIGMGIGELRVAIDVPSYAAAVTAAEAIASALEAELGVAASGAEAIASALEAELGVAASGA